jgi:hypothetical protein
MPLSGSVQQGPAGIKGFDANTPLSTDAARAFYEAGYRFAVRYVGRVEMKSNDLTAAEAQRILDAGLALMVVQHVLNPGWSPTEALGTQYGANAATFSQQIGIPGGVNVWCDLEGVAGGTPSADVAAYCNAWHGQVAAAGYVPGLYVGDSPGLSAQQIYSRLRFQHYWGAYNLNSDEVPATRGLQLRQREGSGGTIAGITTEAYDDDHTMTDALGGQVLWLAPTA